jgi:hypothetical protein
LPTDTMESSTTSHVTRGITFHLEPLSNNRGFDVLLSHDPTSREVLKHSPGLPRSLAKAAHRQPRFGLRKATPLPSGVRIEFDKETKKMKADVLEKHLFEPMARKIRRSHQGTQPSKRKRRGHKAFHNHAPAVQVSI